MHPATRAHIAAAILAAAAIALFVMQVPGPATALIAGAVGVVVLVPDRSVPRDVAQALQASDSLADASEALGLDGRGILVPHEGSVMLFVPASDLAPGEAPRFDGHTRLAQRPPGIGLWMTPPGAALMAQWPVPQGGIEQAAVTLRKALPALGLGQRVKVERGEFVRVTYRPSMPREASRAWDLQGADATTSFIGAVLCLATQTPVRLVARDEVEAGTRCSWELA